MYSFKFHVCRLAVGTFELPARPEPTSNYGYNNQETDSDDFNDSNRMNVVWNLMNRSSLLFYPWDEISLLERDHYAGTADPDTRYARAG